MKVLETHQDAPAGYVRLVEFANELGIPPMLLRRVLDRMGIDAHPGSGRLILLDEQECAEVRHRIARARELIRELEDLGWHVIRRRRGEQVWVDKP